MAYDERLADRVRTELRHRDDVTERRMFGGLAFLVRGRMCCGVRNADLMVRVPGDEFDAVMQEVHVRPMDFTGRPLRGFAYVSADGVRSATDLARRGQGGRSTRSTGPTRRARGTQA